jgi:hypothetical protein
MFSFLLWFWRMTIAAPVEAQVEGPGQPSHQNQRCSGCFFGFSFATTGLSGSGIGSGTGRTFTSVTTAPARGEMSTGPCGHNSAGTNPAPIAMASINVERLMAKARGDVSSNRQSAIRQEGPEKDLMA